MKTFSDSPVPEKSALKDSGFNLNATSDTVFKLTQCSFFGSDPIS